MRSVLTQRASRLGLLLVLAWFLAWAIRPALGQPLKLGQQAPEIAGAPWINSQPLAMSALSGRVVLVEFWTYG
jgi:hypothetical protein